MAFDVNAGIGGEYITEFTFTPSTLAIFLQILILLDGFQDPKAI
jgi:hypothetical protein